MTPNNNFEKFLQGILDAISGGDVDLPTPSWNHEKYLAAIAGALQDMNPPLEVKEVEHVSTLYETVLGDMVEFEYTFIGHTKTGKGYLLADYNVNPNLETDVAYLGDDECLYTGQKGDDNKTYLDVTLAVNEDPTFDIKGETFKIIRTETETIVPPNMLNLYDPNDPHGDGSYLPEYVEYDDEKDCFVLSAEYDANPIYERLRRGQNVYVRMYDGFPTASGGVYLLVIYWCVEDDESPLRISTGSYGPILCENFKGTVADADADDGDDDGDHGGIVPPEES